MAMKIRYFSLADDRCFTQLNPTQPVDGSNPQPALQDQPYVGHQSISITNAVVSCLYIEDSPNRGSSARPLSYDNLPPPARMDRVVSQLFKKDSLPHPLPPHIHRHIHRRTWSLNQLWPDAVCVCVAGGWDLT